MCQRMSAIIKYLNDCASSLKLMTAIGLHIQLSWVGESNNDFLVLILKKYVGHAPNPRAQAPSLRYAS